MNSRAKINDFLEFANRYTNYKEEGLIPTVIASKMQSEYGCSSTCYYRALHYCRKQGLITDSYEETKAAAIMRQKNAGRENNTVQSTVCSCGHICEQDSSDTVVSLVPRQEEVDTDSPKKGLQLVSLCIRVGMFVMKILKRK